MRAVRAGRAERASVQAGACELALQKTEISLHVPGGDEPLEPHPWRAVGSLQPTKKAAEQSAAHRALCIMRSGLKPIPLV